MDQISANMQDPMSPIRRGIAIGSMFATLGTTCLFVAIATFFTLFPTVLGKESFFLPVSGLILILATVAGLAGLATGIMELVGSREQRGFIVVTVIMNAAFCWGVFGLSIFGMTGQL